MNKSQYRIMGWGGVLVATTSGLALWLGEPAFGVASLLSVLFIVIVLVSNGFSAHASGTSRSEYFGASSLMSSTTTLQSLGSAWVMLGNVVVAGMILGQIFGVLAVWLVVTWSLAFVLMSKRVNSVRSVLKTDDTLHTFLHSAYGSLAMRRIASCITLFVAFGVFCTELIAAIALLVAVLPAPQAAVIAPLMIVLIVIAMCVSATAGGLRGVITTDALMWPIVIAGVFSFIIVTLQIGSTQSLQQNLGKLIPVGLDPWGIFAFLVGITALQVPLLLGDFGTWQRIKATSENESKSLASHTLRQAGWQAFLWGVPIVAGIAVLGLPALYEKQSGNLYASSAPLIEAIRYWITASQVPIILRVGVITVFLIGMLAVMSSTANTYLLIAMETWVTDLFPREPKDAFADTGALGRDAVSRARVLCIFMGLVACLPVAILVQFNVNLVAIIVTVFSVQVALAPAAVLALYQPELAKSLCRPVVLSTVGAFAGALTFGFFTGYGLTGWWQAYGSFLTAVVALGLPTATISVSLLSAGHGIDSVQRFLGKLLWPWAK